MRGRPRAPETELEREVAGYLAERGVGARGISRATGWSLGYAQRLLIRPRIDVAGQKVTGAWPTSETRSEPPL